MSDEETGCSAVGIAHAIPHAKIMLYGTASETFD